MSVRIRNTDMLEELPDVAGMNVKGVVRDKNGNPTSYAYDERGNVTGKTDAMGLMTTITYDAKNNPLTRTDPHFDTTTFAYDANGNLTKTIDPLGRTSTLTPSPSARRMSAMMASALYSQLAT